MHSKTAVLLVNIGTPLAPTPKAVGAYLKEFLMDPFVIDIPWIFRFILVHLLIVPRRSKASALLYQKVWTEKGSPLLAITKSLENKLQNKLGRDFLVMTAMRYGEPSFESALLKAQKENCEDVIVFPLYPQYSQAANLSCEVFLKKVLQKIHFQPRTLKTISYFYQHPAFINAYQKLFRRFISGKKYDHFLMSYHGLPERQLKKVSPKAASYCLAQQDCCQKKCEANAFCYRAHCFDTSTLLQNAFQLQSDQVTTCFQSRLGRTPWIQPYTDYLYESLPQKGMKKIAVLAPSFIVDCLETLEEIQIRGKEQFLENGGEVFDMMPCLNDSEEWVDACEVMIQEYAQQKSEVL